VGRPDFLRQTEFVVCFFVYLVLFIACAGILGWGLFQLLGLFPLTTFVLFARGIVAILLLAAVGGAHFFAEAAASRRVWRDEGFFHSTFFLFDVVRLIPLYVRYLLMRPKRDLSDGSPE